MFTRMVVTGDLLRPRPSGRGGWDSATGQHISWLWSLIMGPAKLAGCDASMLAWDAGIDSRHGVFFDTPRLYKAAGEELGVDGWARLIGSETFPDSPASEMILDHVADALVVGYEMPDAQIATLARAQVPFIDVILHPVRFLDDLVFALRTNVPAIHEVLRQTALSPSRIHQQVALIRAKSTWLGRPEPSLPPGTALIVGQVGTDRALAKKEGGFHDLGEHLARLHQLCADHPKVLFKPHPYVPGDNTTCRQAIKKLPTIQSTTINFYHLMCQSEVEHVVALNSSCLVEAPYFGKTSEALVPFLYDFDNDAPQGDGLPGAAVPQMGSWIEPAFWHRVLTGEATTDSVSPMMPIPANRLRRSMNADWGYSFIEKVVA
jgi:hypothetical protein